MCCGLHPERLLVCEQQSYRRLQYNCPISLLPVPREETRNPKRPDFRHEKRSLSFCLRAPVFPLCRQQAMAVHPEGAEASCRKEGHPHSLCKSSVVGPLLGGHQLLLGEASSSQSH